MSSDQPSATPDAATEIDADYDDAVLYEDQVQPEYGILGLTLREIIMVGAWLVVFVMSFFPVSPVAGSVWSTGIGWILTVGVPTAAVFLVVLRRFSPQGIRRVGSLGIDQFASVAAAVAAVSWAQLLWWQVLASIDSGLFLVGWATIVAFIGALALVAVTVAGPFIPRLREDFEGRMETLAHRNANPVRPVVARPRPVAAPVAPVESEEDTDDDVEEPAEAAQPADAADAADVPALDETATDRADAGGDADEADAATLPAEEPSAQDAQRTSVVDFVPHLAASDAAAAPTADDDDATRVLEPIVPVEPAAETTSEDRASDDADHHGVEALDEIFGTGESVDDDAEDLVITSRRDRAANRAQSTSEPFWILASTERDVLDDQGEPLFRIGPNAWTLVVEDRDGAYVVRHDDGRIGYLHDITDITKG